MPCALGCHLEGRLGSHHPSEPSWLGEREGEVVSLLCTRRNYVTLHNRCVIAYTNIISTYMYTLIGLTIILHVYQGMEGVGEIEYVAL